MKFESFLWDFDGVLMNSNAIRDKGFEKVLCDFPQSEIAALMVFHRSNGGLSRYVKFRYFFEEIRNEKITDQQVEEWAARFSKIMRDLLVNNELLIQETLNFVKQHYCNIPMHIVSGSDQEELRFICRSLNIDQYFKSIHGSPAPKKQLVQAILKTEKYNAEECILIGDSINDYEAATLHKVKFMAYNNTAIDHLTNYSIDF